MESDKKKRKAQKKLDLKRRYKEKHPEEFLSSSSRKESTSQETVSSSNVQLDFHMKHFGLMDTPINAHSTLMSYFDRLKIYKDRLMGASVNPIRKMVHVATVRSIITKYPKDISFFEVLCCDMVMCYFPEQYSQYRRQKCYDLLIKDIDQHHPYVKIENGNLVYSIVVENGKDVIPNMYSFRGRVGYLDRYYLDGFDRNQSFEV